MNEREIHISPNIDFLNNKFDPDIKYKSPLPFILMLEKEKAEKKNLPFIDISKPDTWNYKK